MRNNEKYKKTERKIFFLLTVIVLLYGLIIKVAETWHTLWN